MKINVVIPLDTRGTKMVNQYRFQYDRQSIKLCDPAVEFMSPLECFVNLRTLSEELEVALRGFHRFKLTISGVDYHVEDSDIEETSGLCFRVEENKNLMSIRRKLAKIKIFQGVDREDFSPAIPFYSAGGQDGEDIAEIFDSVNESATEHDFFASQLKLMMMDKSNKWEMVSEYPL
ncbi:MAG: hypothetical protein OEZ36_07875 [Spirochaetota bacterium]|nr:hypothetical protein [Spirochaetota bacterium]